MDIGSILMKVGTGIIKKVVPGASEIIDVVNGFLPDDNKLPADATGEQVQGAIDTLPAADRASIMSKELDVKIEEIRGWSNVVNSLAAADATGSSTRPWIAKLMAGIVAFAIIVFVSIWGYAVGAGKTEMIKATNDAWPMIATILGTPTVLLRAYFGLRTEEKKARYATSSGQEHISGIAGMIGKFLKR